METEFQTVVGSSINVNSSLRQQGPNSTSQHRKWVVKVVIAGRQHPRTALLSLGNREQGGNGLQVLGRHIGVTSR